MIRRILSVGRRGRVPFPSRSRGFSIVEVMMSLVLVAIGTALALPSYRDMVEKRQVTNGAEQVASFINSAQGAAMKTNRIVKVSWDHADDDEWCVGAAIVNTLGSDPCDCSGVDESAPACEIDGQAYVLNESHAGNLDLMHDMGSEDTGSWSFDPVRGFSPDLNGDLTFSMRSPSGDFRIDLMVNQTGRVILCSGDSSHAVPGYEPCPEPAVEEGP